MTEARTIPDTGAPGSETAAAPQPFDVAAPLPGGTTVLEARAGTGKTYAIVGVAARKIADGLPIDKLLLVTFSRSASAELRERMRARLADLVVALDPARVHTDRDGDDDPVLRTVLTGSPDEIAARRVHDNRALGQLLNRRLVEEATRLWRGRRVDREELRDGKQAVQAVVVDGVVLRLDLGLVAVD